MLYRILAPPILTTYYELKDRAINVTKSQQLINVIQRNTPGGFNNFRPPTNRPFFQRGSQPPWDQNQYTQRQYNSTNAPCWLNNTLVPMDTSAQFRAPPNCRNQQRRDGLRMRGNAVQANYGAQGDVAQTKYVPPRKRGPCFKCGKEGHFARDCRSTRAHYINYMDQSKDMSQLQAAIRMFDTLPLDQKDAFIQKYKGGQEDFAEV